MSDFSELMPLDSLDMNPLDYFRELQAEIDRLQSENAELRKCWKCGEDNCNHRNLVAIEQAELLALRVEMAELRKAQEQP